MAQNEGSEGAEKPQPEHNQNQGTTQVVSSRRRRGRSSQIPGVLVGFILGMVGTLVVEYLRPRLFSPDISIEFDQRRPYLIQTMLGSDVKREYYHAYYFRLAIKNNSEYSIARNCVVMLTGLWHMDEDGKFKEDKNFEPVRLEWLPHMPPDISAGMRVFAPFAQIADPEYQTRYEAQLYSGDPTKPQFRFRVPNHPRWMSSHVPPGRHKFRITIHFDNRPPMEREFELVWSGKWSGNYDSMLKEVIIRKRDQS